MLSKTDITTPSYGDSGGRNGHLRDGHMRALPDLLHLLIDSCSEDSDKTRPCREMVNVSRDETGTVGKLK